MVEELLIETAERRELQLTTGFTVSGTVRDAQGEPVADARVIVDGDRKNASRSDVHGRFSLEEVRRGEVTIVAKDPRRLGVEDTSLHLDIQANRDDLELELPATGELRGRVLDEHGAPAMGAEVVLRAAEGFGRTRLVSGEDGSFTMFPAPGAYRIKAKWSAKENGAPGQPIDIFHGGPTDVTLRLPPRGDYRFRGHVVDENKDPLADVAVRVDGIREVLTDDDGSFEMTGLQDATVNVSLDSNDGAHVFHRELDISDDRQHEFIVTTTVEVCGVVEGLDPTGTYSVQGLRFSAVDPSFCVPGIAQGSQTLVAHQGTRSASVKIQVTPSPSRITFRLTPSSGPLNGHVGRALNSIFHPQRAKMES